MNESGMNVHKLNYKGEFAESYMDSSEDQLYKGGWPNSSWN